jgi:hypothetical protein
MIRRQALEQVEIGDYLFDIDVVYELVQRGQRIVAMVDVPIRHYFCDGVGQFRRKTRRRVDDYFFFASSGRRSYPWTSRRRSGLIRFVLSTVTVVPVAAAAVRGFRRAPDPAWLFHVPACWITLWVYGVGVARGRLRPRMLQRGGWRQ